MYRLSWEKEGNPKTPFTGNMDHFCVLKSKTGRLGRKSANRATMNRPSGDQRDDDIPDEPGMTVISPLERSRMHKSSLGSPKLPRPNTTFFPSADQLGSPADVS